jgi:hypothetical protein
MVVLAIAALVVLWFWAFSSNHTLPLPSVICGRRNECEWEVR